MWSDWWRGKTGLKPYTVCPSRQETCWETDNGPLLDSKDEVSLIITNSDKPRLGLRFTFARQKQTFLFRCIVFMFTICILNMNADLQHKSKKFLVKENLIYLPTAFCSWNFKFQIISISAIQRVKSLSTRYEFYVLPLFWKSDGFISEVHTSENSGS